MRRSVQLFTLPLLLWYFSCMWGVFHSLDRMSSDKWDTAKNEIKKMATAEDRAFQSLHASRATAAAQAEDAAEGAKRSALIWMSMGALAMMATTSLLGWRLVRYEKRLQKLEEELAGLRATQPLELLSREHISSLG